MPESITVSNVLGILVIGAPLALVTVLGIASLLGNPLSERASARACRWTIVIGLLGSFATLGFMLNTGDRHIVINLGNLVSFQPNTPGEHAHYHFSLKFEFDRLSVPFAILSYVLCGTVCGFATRYLHRESGYNRFFVLYALFLAGMVVASLADTIETLFIGWEFVGLSSALLVAYFQERPAPTRNGLSVWIVYRVSDAALLLAAVALHHVTGEGDFDRLLGSQSWPHTHTTLNQVQTLMIGLLLLLAAAGKSALVPFSGWLPRAMEGPTPSSAVFYGALSVHLGVFLLLRMSPLIETSVWLALGVVILGLITAIYAYITGSVQTDIKCALSFASLVQVGIIVAEVGLAHWVPFLLYVALVHVIGHACLRTLQFLRAPTLLQDYRHLENAIGDRLPRSPGPLTAAPAHLRSWVYRFALERGYLDAILTDYIARPFVRVFLWFDRWERRWAAFLAGSGTANLPPHLRPKAPPSPPAASQRVEQHA